MIPPTHFLISWVIAVESTLENHLAGVPDVSSPLVVRCDRLARDRQLSVAGAVLAAVLERMAMDMVRAMGIECLAQSSHWCWLFCSDAVAGMAAWVLAAGDGLRQNRFSVCERVEEVVPHQT